MGDEKLVTREDGWCLSGCHFKADDRKLHNNRQLSQFQTNTSCLRNVTQLKCLRSFDIFDFQRTSFWQTKDFPISVCHAFSCMFAESTVTLVGVFRPLGSLLPASEVPVWAVSSESSKKCFCRVLITVIERVFSLMLP